MCRGSWLEAERLVAGSTAVTGIAAPMPPEVDNVFGLVAVRAGNDHLFGWLGQRYHASIINQLRRWNHYPTSETIRQTSRSS
jgi:hypothetical protein